MGEQRAQPGSLVARMRQVCTADKTAESFQRDFLSTVVTMLHADAADVWYMQTEGFSRAQVVERTQGVLRRTGLNSEQEYDNLGECLQKGAPVRITHGGKEEAFDPLQPPGSKRETQVVYIPVRRDNERQDVVRVIWTALTEAQCSSMLPLAELACGYYHLYWLQQQLGNREMENERFDRLSRAICQVYHYTFSTSMADVAVNSALETLPLDRVVLLEADKKGKLSIASASSTVNPSNKSAWTRALCEMGETVLATGIPLEIVPEEFSLQDIEERELSDKASSYHLISSASTLLVHPLLFGSEKPGVMVMEVFAEEPLADYDRKACHVYSTHVASALGNHRLFQRVPFHSFYARKLEKEIERTSRRPMRTGRIAKFALIAAVLLCAGWFVGVYQVPEKVGAKCVVVPSVSRTLTAPLAGQVETVNFKQGQVVKKGAVVIKLRTDKIQLELSKEKENYSKITAQIAKLRGQVQDATKPERRNELLAELRIQNHKLEAKKNRISLLKQKLKDCFIRAPFTGTMLSPEQPGEMVEVSVSEGERLTRMGQFREKVRVKVAVPASRIDDVEPGQDVTIRLQSFIEERAFDGRILRVSQRSVTYKKSNVFMARVELKNQYKKTGQPMLKPGMTGKAKVDLGTKSTYAMIYGGKLYRKVRYWLY